MVFASFIIEKGIFTREMKLRLLCLIFFILIGLFLTTQVTHGITLQSGIITGNNVNVRSGPGLETDIVCRLQQGDVVNVRDQTGEWLKVQLADEQTGWVYQQFVQIKMEPDNILAENSPPDADPKPGLHSLFIGKILDYAQSLIGISYVYGGASLRGFDCSGFTMFVLGKFGIQLPHEASRQMTMGLDVPSRDDLIPGDLVFFKTLGSKVVNHVGIYLGNNLFIHAASGFGTVRISTLNDSYYVSRYVGGRRMIPNESGNSPG